MHLPVVAQSLSTVTMHDVLHILKSHEDLVQVSHALRQLDGMLDHDDEYLEEARFDFMMEDGIQTIGSLIRRANLRDSDIHRGMNLMFRVAEDNACHWQCIWESIGEREGIIQILEVHGSNEYIFMCALNLCRRISNFQLLQVEAKDILRWIPLWDLLLCGVESCMDRCVDIFLLFCLFVESQKDELIPFEMHGRIGFALVRGLESLRGSDADYNFLKMTLESIVSRFTDGAHTIRHNNKKQTDHPCMFIPCSPAA